VTARSNETKDMRGTDTNDSSDDDDDDDEEEDDNLEVMFTRCRRMSSFRIVRTSSIRNLTAGELADNGMLIPAFGNHNDNNNNNPALTRFMRATSGFGIQETTVDNEQRPSRNLILPTDTLNDRLSRNCPISTDDIVGKSWSNHPDASLPPTQQELIPSLTHTTSGDHVVAELKSLVGRTFRRG
jgi:hypothetical protein